MSLEITVIYDGESAYITTFDGAGGIGCFDAIEEQMKIDIAEDEFLSEGVGEYQIKASYDPGDPDEYGGWHYRPYWELDVLSFKAFPAECSPSESTGDSRAD